MKAKKTFRVHVFYYPHHCYQGPGWTWYPEIDGDHYVNPDSMSYHKTHGEALRQATTWLSIRYAEHRALSGRA